MPVDNMPEVYLSFLIPETKELTWKDSDCTRGSKAFFTHTWYTSKIYDAIVGIAKVHVDFRFDVQSFNISNLITEIARPFFSNRHNRIQA